MDANALLKELEQLVQQLQEAVQDLYEQVSETIGRIPDWLGYLRDRLLDAWDWLCEKLTPLWDWIARYFSRPGDPGALQALAGRWTNEVGQPVGGEATVADAGTLLADDVWVGIAADRYKQALGPQRAAIAAAKTSLADTMSKALGAVATALWVEFVAVGVALVTLLGLAATAIAAACGVFTAPAAPFALGVGVAAFLAATTAAGIKLSVDSGNAKSDIERGLADAAFGGGSWPKAVVS
ncbi:hypothetical protein [Cellulomonas composti]|uniref:ESX-1 secretion-associated protein EspA/EspE-like domain-containing protein n=1 Tax=Cellulomonas composti TaxID=266130 RepID=A0A511J7I4_9CELL|nr:hypothetical protein [Cellulomonas composti]GEL93951.1 hypothetical protein CCO02nite_06090 [Cellulomonas composti]